MHAVRNLCLGKNCRMTSEELLQLNLVSWVVCNSSTTHRIVRKLNGVLKYHIGMWKLSKRWQFGLYQQNLVWFMVHNSSLLTCRTVWNSMVCQIMEMFILSGISHILSLCCQQKEIVLIAVWSWQQIVCQKCLVYLT